MEKGEISPTSLPTIYQASIAAGHSLSFEESNWISRFRQRVIEGEYGFNPGHSIDLYPILRGHGYISDDAVYSVKAKGSRLRERVLIVSLVAIANNPSFSSDSLAQEALGSNLYHDVGTVRSQLGIYEKLGEDEKNSPGDTSAAEKNDLQTRIESLLATTSLVSLESAADFLKLCKTRGIDMSHLPGMPLTPTLEQVVEITLEQYKRRQRKQ